MPRRGGRDRENWTAFNANQYHRYMRKRKDIVEWVNVVLPQPAFSASQSKSTDTNRAMYGCTSPCERKADLVRRTVDLFLSLRHPVYSVHAARWANGAPERWSNGLTRRGLSSLYFYFTRLPQLPWECITHLVRFSNDQMIARYTSFFDEDRLIPSRVRAEFGHSRHLSFKKMVSNGDGNIY